MEHSHDTVYELVKEQCMNAFVAESIGRPDIATVCPQAQILLDKVSELSGLQQSALSSLVSSSLTKSDNYSENIFAATSRSQYGRFIFLLTITKLLITHFESEHAKTAKTIVGEIQDLLNDTTFKSSLYEDNEYQKLVTPPEKKSHVDLPEIEKKSHDQSYYQYIEYGIGTLALGAIGVMAFTFARSKK